MGVLIVWSVGLRCNFCYVDPFDCFGRGTKYSILQCFPLNGSPRKSVSQW